LVMVSISRKTNRRRNKVPLKRPLSTAQMCLLGYVRKKAALTGGKRNLDGFGIFDPGRARSALPGKEEREKEENLSRQLPVPDDNMVSHHDVKMFTKTGTEDEGFVKISRKYASPKYVNYVAQKEPPDSFLVAVKVARHNIFQQMISVDFPNEFAGTKMICDICWILSQQISDNLADWIIPLFLERFMDAQQICPVFVLHNAHHLTGIFGIKQIQMIELCRAWEL